MIVPSKRHVTPDQRFALEQYGKFLRGASEYLSCTSKDKSKRTAMIACLLVVSEEWPFFLSHSALCNITDYKPGLH